MPVPTALATTLYGAAYGFLPIGWIILNAVFLYNLTVHRAVRHRERIGRTAVDRPADPGAAGRILVRRVHRRRVGVRHAGGDLLRAVDWPRVHAAVCGRTVAHRQYGAGCVRGDRHADSDAGRGHWYPGDDSGSMAGRQLPFVSLIVPAWLVVTMSGWRGLRGVWPAVLVCGGTFALVQFCGATLSASNSSTSPAACCRSWRSPCSARVEAEGRLGVRWRPRRRRRGCADRRRTRATGRIASLVVTRAWMPWVFLEHRGDHLGTRAGEGGAALAPGRSLAPAPTRCRCCIARCSATIRSSRRRVDRGADRRRRLSQRARRSGRAHAQLGLGDRHGDPARRDASARSTCACRRGSFSRSRRRRCGACARRSRRSC